MRNRFGSLLVAFFASLALGSESSGLTQDELGAVKRALSLWNLDLPDLGYNKPAKVDPYRLEIVDRALGAPLEALGVLTSWQDATRKSTGHSALVRHAWAQVVAFPETKKATVQLPSAELEKLPEPLRAPIRIAAEGTAAANAAIREAFAGLSESEKADLMRSLPEFTELPGVTLPMSANGTKLARSATLKLIDKVEVARIRSAANVACAAWERGAAFLRSVNITIPKPIYLNLDGVKVVVGSTGDDRHVCKPNELIVDLKGNDSYNGRPGTGIFGVGALIDMAGADRFNLDDASAGAGIAGVGAVLDFGGNERVYGKSLCLGAGLLGTGVFFKEGGHDEYRATAFAQGAGEFGVGLLVDSKGNERYDAGYSAQGYASLKGFGWLVDRSGNDVYTIGGLVSGAPLAPNSWHCFGQGAASGYRLDSGGQGAGAGILSDLAGDDLYKGGMYCQGASYWYALGALIDGSGHDSYVADYYAQTAAMHLTAAYLIDLMGDDVYTVRTGAMHAIGHDYGVAVMLDREGDDVYAGKDSRPGQAVANGVSLFIDSKGSDRYVGPVGYGRADRGSGSVAVFVDLAGADVYASGLKDGEVALNGSWGVAMDLAGPSEPAGAAAPTRPRPKPGTAPMPSEAEIERIYAQAVRWGVGSIQQELQENVDKLVAIGKPAFEWMLKNKLASADRLAMRAFEAVASSLGTEGHGLIVAYLKSFDEEAAANALALCASQKIKEAEPFLKEAMLRPRLQGLAIRAAGAIQAVSLVPELTGFAMGPDKARSLNAVLALDAIGSEDSAHTFVALCTSPELPIRKAAIKALAKWPERALAAAKILLTRDSRVLRVGIEILGEIGTPEAEDLLIKQFSSEKPEVRVEAIRAAALKNPSRFLNAIEPLANDPNEDVRAMARWALSRKP